LQCVIDLAKGVLRIGTTGTETKFLGEGDVHESARLSGADELKDSENPELQKAIAESAKSTEGVYIFLRNFTFRGRQTKFNNSVNLVKH